MRRRIVVLRHRIVVLVVGLLVLSGVAVSQAPAVSAHASWEHPMNQFNHYIGDQARADQFCNAVLLYSIDAYPWQLFQDADGRTVDPRKVWWAWGNLAQQRCYWNQ